jgi:hypothetical protein
MSKNGDFNTKNLTSIISGVPGARFRVKAVFESMVLGFLKMIKSKNLMSFIPSFFNAFRKIQFEMIKRIKNSVSFVVVHLIISFGRE